MPGISADLTLDYSGALADADSLGDALEAKLSNVKVSVEADTSEAQTQIDQLATDAQALDPTVTVDADVSEAQAQVDSLDDSLQSAGSSAEDTGGKFGGLTSAADDLGSGVSSAGDLVSGASDDLEDFASTAASAVDGLASGAEEIGGALSSVAGGAADIAEEGGGAIETVGTLGSGISGTVSLVTTITGALAIGAGAIGLFGDSAEEADPKLDDFADSVRGAAGAISGDVVSAVDEFLRSRNQLDDFAAAGIKSADAVRAVSGVSKEARGTLSDLADALKRVADVGGSNATAYSNYGASVETLKGRVRDLVGQLRETDPALGALAERLLATGQLNEGNVQSLIDLVGKYKDAKTEAQDLGTVAESAAKQIETSIGAAGDALDDYADGTGDATTATNLLDQAVSTLQTHLDLLLGNFVSSEQATGALQQAINGLNFDIATAKVPLDAFTSSATDGGQSLLDMASQAQAAAGAITRNGGSATEALVPLQNYRNELQTIRDKLSAAGLDTTFIDGIISHVDGAILELQARKPAAEGAGKTLGDGVTSGWGQGLVPFRSKGAEAAQQGIEGVNSKKPEATGVGTGVGREVVTAFRAGTQPIRGVGESAGVEAAQGIESAKGAAESAGAAVGGGATSAARNALGSWFGIGQDAASGMSGGILSVAGSVASAARSIAAGAIAAARAELASASPSKVMIEIGQDFGEGFAIGIEIKVDRVADAATEVVERATTAATEAIDEWTADQLAQIRSVAAEIESLWLTDDAKAAMVAGLWAPDKFKAAVTDQIVFDSDPLNTKTGAAIAQQALDLIKAGGDKINITDQIAKAGYDALIGGDLAAARIATEIVNNYTHSAQFANSNTEGIAYLKNIDARLAEAQRQAAANPTPLQLTIRLGPDGTATVEQSSGLTLGDVTTTIGSL